MTVKLLEGHREVEITPYSFWGGALSPLVVDRSNISVVLDAPKSDRAKRNQIDIQVSIFVPNTYSFQGTFGSTKLKTTKRYLIERWKGHVKDENLYKLLFVFDND